MEIFFCTNTKWHKSLEKDTRDEVAEALQHVEELDHLDIQVHEEKVVLHEDQVGQVIYIEH